MGTAKQPGGLYYVNGVAVDAEGKPVEGAPALGPDTPASEQPGAPGTGTTPEERLAGAIVSALKPAATAAPATATTSAKKSGARKSAAKTGGKKSK